jgi:hypothetical protein
MEILSRPPRATVRLPHTIPLLMLAFAVGALLFAALSGCAPPRPTADLSVTSFRAART